MTIEKANDPSAALPVVQSMGADWQLIDALLGGTKAMRAAGKTYLPQWPKEKQDVYKARLNASTLLPVFGETVRNLTARVFAQPIQLASDVDTSIAAQLKNIDQRGNDLQVWSKDWFEKALAYGLCHALVDYPPATGIKTKAQEKAAGVRPYAVLIDPRSVIGWRTAAESGVEVLKQFRFYESVTENDGAFGVATIQQIRVLEPGKWATYRKNARGEWTLHEEGTTSLPVIPLVTFYTKRTGTLCTEPPLLDLAHLNVKHWQSQSDQDNILHIARVPLLTVIGADTTKELSIGGNSVLKLPVDGDAKYVEHTGKAIEAGRDALKDLLDEMRMAGAKLLHRQVATVKTTQQAKEDSDEDKSLLEMMAEQFEEAINRVIHLFCQWQGMEPKGSVEVRGNFDDDPDPAATLAFLLDMAKEGKLSKQTLFEEVQRRSVLWEELTWEEEAKRLAGETTEHDERKEGMPKGNPDK